MVALGISEFTFGFAFLYEQTQQHWEDLVAFPILPSLQQEADVGWDAHLPTNGTDYYYQFKMSEYLLRSNAKYIADGTYHSPYYRIAFHRRNANRQHRRLREHSRTNPETFYIVPEVHDLDAFNAAFMDQQIGGSSRIIPLNECDDIDDGDQHYITYQPNDPTWIQHSEKKRHEKSYSGKELVSFYRESRPKWKHIDDRYATELCTKTLQAVWHLEDLESREAAQERRELFDYRPENQPRAQNLIQTSRMLAVYFGATLVLVGTRG